MIGATLPFILGPTELIVCRDYSSATNPSNSTKNTAVWMVDEPVGDMLVPHSRQGDRIYMDRL
jgi:hypothetical protein